MMGRAAEGTVGTKAVSAFGRNATPIEKILMVALLVMVFIVAPPALRGLLLILAAAYVALQGVRSLTRRVPGLSVSGGQYSAHTTIRYKLGVAGAVVLFIGLFAPVVQVPLLGSMNYFQHGQGGSLLLLAFAIVTIVMAPTYRFAYLKWIGAVSLLLVGLTLIQLTSVISKARHDLTGARLESNPFTGLEHAALASIQLQWGWAFLIIGSLLILVADLDDRWLSRILNQPSLPGGP